MSEIERLARAALANINEHGAACDGPKDLRVELAELPDLYVRNSSVEKEGDHLSRAEKAGLCIHRYGMTVWEG